MPRDKKTPERRKFGPADAVTVESYHALEPYNVSNYRGHWETPSCFNGHVSVFRYRITCEVIEEPIEVIHARLVDLWETSDNYHHLAPLRAAADDLGFVLDPAAFGKRRKRDAER